MGYHFSSDLSKQFYRPFQNIALPTIFDSIAEDTKYLTHSARIN